MRRLTVKVALFVLLVVSLIFAMWLQQLSIQKIVIAGTSDDTSTSMKQEIEKVLSQTYFGIIPKSNFLVYPKHAIADSILKTHPEMGSVDIGTEHVHTLNVRVIERKPAALWCLQGDCYFMDDHAYVYAETASSSSLLSINNTVATTSSPLGSKAMTTSMFADILSVAAELSSSSLPVENISIAEGGQYIFKILNNGKIIFSDKKPFQQSYEDLVSALKSPVFATSGEFQYIDTRFGNKIFYRLGKLGAAESATSSPFVVPTSTASVTSSTKAR